MFLALEHPGSVYNSNCLLHVSLLLSYKAIITDLWGVFNAWLIGWLAEKECCCRWGKVGEKLEAKVSYDSAPLGNWGSYNITTVKPLVVTSDPRSWSPERGNSHNLTAYLWLLVLFSRPLWIKSLQPIIHCHLNCLTWEGMFFFKRTKDNLWNQTFRICFSVFEHTKKITQPFFLDLNSLLIVHMEINGIIENEHLWKICMS